MVGTNNQIGESVRLDDDKLIIKRTFNLDETLKDAAYSREKSMNSFGSDWKHVGDIHPAMVTNWLKEAGVAWSDTEAVKDVIKTKLMSGEFSKLRDWEGTYCWINAPSRPRIPE